ncbi:uncharacterized protein LOC123553333 [Mercenaria mercenaria]|uniref:uncharacterized protein LOC123553333 n=1 Tax=Mercenaria mercenaria TaxID=6596 RepID=UPI00234EC780|nr:uncharacterized protein LOC123553333 [Mercenaria mercenaria]
MATRGSINEDILTDKTFDLLCRVCKRKGKYQEAEKYCVECQDYYCLSCVKVHEDIPSLTGHKIIGGGQFQSGSVQMSGSSKILSQAPAERCDRHTYHYIDMYCQNHDVVGCGTCMAVAHRLCKDVFYIPEFLQTNTSITSTSELKQTLESVSKILTECCENFSREKQKLLKRKITIIENVKQCRKEINERLDELEKNTTADIEDEYNSLIDEIDKEMKLLKTNRVSVNAFQDKLASSGNTQSQIFVYMKKGEHAAKIVEENKPQIHAADDDFEVDQRISTVLKEINVLGKVTQRKSGNAEDTGTGDDQQDEALPQVKSSKKYCVQVQSDEEECYIVSACTLDDGTILLSDRSNFKLKRFDSSTYTVIDYCDLPGEQWQVCSINKHQAAVCLPGQQEVHFISLSNRMTLTNKITTDFDCYGLAYADGNLYISGETSIYIYSVSGRKLKKLSMNQSGQELFSFIRSLAVSEDGSKVYVTDCYNGLVILNNHENIVEKFDGDQLDGAFDSYLTGRGSLLVCGSGSNNVLQFGRDGKLIGEIAKSDDEDTDYQAICCNQQMSKMIIGRDDDEIEVYNIM